MTIDQADAWSETTRAPAGVRVWKSAPIPALFVAALLGLWEFASGRWVDPFFISRPSSIVVRIWSWAASGYLSFHFVITAQEAVLGFVLGAICGMVLGILLGTFASLNRALNPVIMGLYSLPKVAVIPLLVLWFGITLRSKVALAAILVFFPVLFNTIAGVRTIDKTLLQLVQIMGANRLQSFYYIAIPAALSSILVGLRVSLPMALVGAVVGEMWAASRGLGYLVAYTGSQFDTTGVFAALSVLMILSVVLSYLLDLVDNHFQRWRGV